MKVETTPDGRERACLRILVPAITGPSYREVAMFYVTDATDLLTLLRERTASRLDPHVIALNEAAIELLLRSQA